MDLNRLQKIRKLVLIAMFADDLLMERFVLKGGAALDLAYALYYRESVDIDLSIPDDFSAEELADIIERIEKSLGSIFAAEGYKVFDFEFLPSPRQLGADQPEFWGGYIVKFKLLEKKNESELKRDPNRAREMATTAHIDNTKTFKIDISKYEWCANKEEIEVDGYTVYVYTPKMLVFEKLRAICQQMPEYALVKRKKPRTRDFFDIYVLVHQLGIEFFIEDSALLKSIFRTKKVPIELLSKIADYKHHYESEVSALRDTLLGKNQNDFDFDVYFNYVIALANQLANGLVS